MKIGRALNAFVGERGRERAREIDRQTETRGEGNGCRVCAAETERARAGRETRGERGGGVR